MKNLIEKISRRILPNSLFSKILKILDKRQFEKWKISGCPAPSPHYIKQTTIADYQKKYGYNILVETGTYLGDMVEAQKDRFEKVISIELGVNLFKKAVKRFRKNTNVTIVQGDSGKVLSTILKDINEPAIFWLDGHYSAGITAKGDKECPIFEELDSIFSSKSFNHILLIDDARCFIGEGDYPTVDRLTEYIKSKNDKYQLKVKHDILRYVI